MSRSRFLGSLAALMVALFALTACSDGTLLDGAMAPAAHDGNAGAFTAPLSGAEEVPAADTLARGQAVFRVQADGIHYRLVVANLFDVLQSHIHLAPAGQNGPVVAFLYPDAPPAVLLPGRTSGVLAEGIITAADLRGPLAGASLEDLVTAMRDGGAYVNVHTTAFPGGEIRGQIR
jgi:hypothetical protein